MTFYDLKSRECGFFFFLSYNSYLPKAYYVPGIIQTI